jgi:hypothetical protein
MKPIQVFGLKAFLAFFLVLVVFSVILKHKTKSLEGAFAVGGAVFLCVLMGRPLLGHNAGSFWVHFRGLLIGAMLGVIICRGLAHGGTDKPGAHNDMYEALQAIEKSAKNQPLFSKGRNYDN